MPSSAHNPSHQSLQRRYQKLQRLCDELLDIVQVSRLDETYRKVVDVPVRIMELETAGLLLVDRFDRRLYVVARGARKRRVRTAEREMTERELKDARAALRRGRVLVTTPARNRPRSGRAKGGGSGDRGAAYIPLMSRGIPFGLLHLRALPGRSWMKDEVELAVHFGGLAAVAIENAKLLSRLTETEGRLRSLIEHIPAIVYTCEVFAPFQTIYVNPQVKTILGYTREQFMNSPGFSMEIVHPADADRLATFANSAVRRRGLATLEYRLRDRWGEYRWFRDEAVLVRDPSGKPIAWHGVLVEITGLKRTRDKEIRFPVRAAIEDVPTPVGPR